MGKTGAAPAQTSAMETVRTCLKNKTYILFLLITAITTGLMSQKDLTIPTRIKAIDPSYAYVGFIYTLASVIGWRCNCPCQVVQGAPARQRVAGPGQHPLRGGACNYGVRARPPRPLRGDGHLHPGGR